MKKQWLKILRRALNSADKMALEVVSLHPETQMQEIENQKDFTSSIKFKVTIKTPNMYCMEHWVGCTNNEFWNTKNR